MWWHPWCPHPWRLAGWTSYGLQVPAGPSAMAWMPEPPSLSLMPLTRRLMLNFCHFQIHDLLRMKVTRVGPPISLITPGLDLSLTVAADLASGVPVGGQVWASPIILQLLRGLLFMEMNLGYKRWMVLMQVEWNEDDQALLVCCVLQWWLWQSTTSHHPGLLVWCWVELVCQPNWWLLTMWMWYIMPQPSSILLLMITAHRTGQPCLGWSIWLLSCQIYHLEWCLPLLVPAMCKVEMVSLCHLWWRSLVFPNNTKSQADWVLVSLLENGMVNVMGHFKMPLNLQDHFGHLLVWGCGLQSGYWFQASDHLGHLIWWHWHKNSGHELKLQINSFSLDAKAHARKLRNYRACVNCVWSTISWRSMHLPPMDSFANVGTLPTWEKVLNNLIEPPDWQFKGQLWTATT